MYVPIARRIANLVPALGEGRGWKEGRIKGRKEGRKEGRNEGRKEVNSIQVNSEKARKK